MAQAETLNVGAPESQKQPPEPQKGAKPPKAKEEGPRPGGRAAEIQWFRVTEDCEVPNRTGKFMMKRGKIFSTKEFSLGELKDAGVKMEETTEPAWHKKLQETGRSFAR
jgi:hypothetical protein